MRIRAVVHEAEEGGFWAEVPALPGCFTQADTMEELERELRDAVEGWLAAQVLLEPDPDGRVLEIAV